MSAVIKPADSPAAAPQKITLTVLLTGGYHYLFEVEPGHPIIKTLFDVLQDFDNKRERRLFQLPVNGGKAMLTFPCDQLVAVMTDPPVLAQPAVAPAALSTAAAQPAQRLVQLGVEASRIAVIDGLFSVEVQARLMAFTLANEKRFVGTTTATKEDNYRESSVLHDFPEFAELMRAAIRKLLPDVHRQLACKSLRGDTIEAQMTAHNDGNFYKIHNDNGSPDARMRELTYVYYYHGQPKAFSGGELKVYDSRVEKGHYVAADSAQVIEPRDNRIVFFLARYMHEVLPIACPSRRFADSRFTINGWVHEG